MGFQRHAPRDDDRPFSPGPPDRAALHSCRRACDRAFPSTLHRSSQRESTGMSQPSGTCPNCGARIVFRWSSSVQTVCEYCKSILVRSDVDLKRVGQVADLPPDSSPIQLNTEGIYRNKAFVVCGRILYEYDQGGWNEWHIMMNDGTSAWLSDAQNEYAVSFSSKAPNLPAVEQIQV